MANLTQFSNTPPISGEIRLFYREQNYDNTDIVRAMTVSNTSIGGVDLIPTLQGLKSVNLRASASGDFSKFEALSISEKPGYFFIDNIDVPLSLISSSLSSSVVFEPFATQKFFNNDYNALISNASEARPSETKFDLDRSAGNVFPVNFEAATGIEINRLVFSDHTHNTQLSFGFGTTNANQSNPLVAFGESVRFRNTEDVVLTVAKTDIEAALGNLNGVIVRETGSEEFSANILFELQVDADREFGTPTGTYDVLAEIKFVNGTLQTTTKSVNRLIQSESMYGASGGTADNFFYARLKTEYWPDTAYNASNAATKVKKILSLINIDESVKHINLRYHTAIPAPYAPPATVPDSNYTSVGYSNSRYNGTKTDKTDYGGVEPAIGAKGITVLTLPSSEISESFSTGSGGFAKSWTNLNNLLSGASGSDGLRNEYELQYEEVAYAGLRDEPVTKIGKIGEHYFGTAANVLANDTDKTFDIYTYQYTTAFGVGDLISVVSSSAVGTQNPVSTTEVMKITSVARVQDPNAPLGDYLKGVSRLTVIRGINGTTLDGNNGGYVSISSHPTMSDPYVTIEQGDRMFGYEGNRLVPLVQRTMCLSPDQVKDAPDNMKIVTTDERGYIVQAYTSASRNGQVG